MPCKPAVSVEILICAPLQLLFALDARGKARLDEKALLITAIATVPNTLCINIYSNSYFESFKKKAL